MANEESAVYFNHKTLVLPFATMLQQFFVGSSGGLEHSDVKQHKFSEENPVCDVGVENVKSQRIQPCPEAILRTSKAWKQPIIPGTETGKTTIIYRLNSV